MDVLLPVLILVNFKYLKNETAWKKTENGIA